MCMNVFQHEIYEPCSPEIQDTFDNRKILTCILLHIFDIYLSYQRGHNYLNHIPEANNNQHLGSPEIPRNFVADAIITRPFLQESFFHLLPSLHFANKDDLDLSLTT